MSDNRLWGLFLSLPAILVIGVGLVVPVLALLNASITASSGADLTAYSAFFADPLNVEVFWRTLRIAGLVTLASALLGYPAALAISAVPKQRRAGLMVLLILPLLVSPVARTYAWVVILSPIGPVNAGLRSLGIVEEPLHLLYTEGAVFLGLLQVVLPLMILPLVSALENLPRDTIAAARTLGAGSLTIFASLILPLTRRGLAIGATLAFTGSCASFITPQILGGGRLLMMETLLFQKVSVLSDLEAGSVIAGIMIAVSLVANALFHRFSPREAGS